jgi:hypothetical protein
MSGQTCWIRTAQYDEQELLGVSGFYSWPRHRRELNMRRTLSTEEFQTLRRAERTKYESEGARKQGSKEARKQGSKEARKQGSKEARKQGSNSEINT